MYEDLDPATYRDSNGWEWIKLSSGRWIPLIGGAEGDPGTGGEGGSGDGDGDPGTGNQGGTGTGTPDGDPNPDEEKKFSQSDVNAIVSREVSQKTRGKVTPKDLGFDSAKELSDYVAAQKAKEKEQQTDAERKLEEAAEQATRDAEANVLSKANDRLVRAEFKVQAKDAGVEWIDDAFAIAQQMEGWQGVEVNDDGDVSGLDKAFFEELKKSKPFLFQATGDGQGPTTPSPRDAGAAAGGSGGLTDQQQDLESKYPVLERLRTGRR